MQAGKDVCNKAASVPDKKKARPCRPERPCVSLSKQPTDQCFFDMLQGLPHVDCYGIETGDSVLSCLSNQQDACSNYCSASHVLTSEGWPKDKAIRALSTEALMLSITCFQRTKGTAKSKALARFGALVTLTETTELC